MNRLSVAGSVEPRDDCLREPRRIFARHDRHIVAEQRVQLDAARMIGAHHRRAARQRFDGDRRQRFEQRRQDEQIRRAIVVGDHVVRDQSRERDAFGHARARARRPRAQLVEERARAADHELRVGMMAQHFGHRVDQVALTRERVQPFHIEQHVTRRQPEPRPQRRALFLRRRRERVDDRRIHDRQSLAREPQLDRLVVQPAAVERDARRLAIRRREQIERPGLGRVVPDLGAVERQHDRLAPSAREPRARLGQQAVAVHVHHIRPADDIARITPDAPRGRDRPDPPHQSLRLIRLHPHHRACLRLRRSRPRRMRDIRHLIPTRHGPSPQMRRQQRIRRLIRRQVWGDMTDAQRHGDPKWSHICLQQRRR